MADPMTYYIVFSGLCALAINPVQKHDDPGDSGAFVACAKEHEHRTILTYPVATADASPDCSTDKPVDSAKCWRAESVEVTGLTALLRGKGEPSSTHLLWEVAKKDFLSVYNLYPQTAAGTPQGRQGDEEYARYKTYLAESRKYFTGRGDTIIDLGRNSMVGPISYYKLSSDEAIKGTDPESPSSAVVVQFYSRFKIELNKPLEIVDDPYSGATIAKLPFKPGGELEVTFSNGPHRNDAIRYGKPDLHFRALFSRFLSPPSSSEKRFRVPISMERAGGAPRCFGMLMAH